VNYHLFSTIEANGGIDAIRHEFCRMVVYKVFYKNYELKKGDLIGMLIQGKKDLRGMKQVESGLRWAKLTFGPIVKDKKAIFVVPNELKLGSDS
jgi:hypothetical protein